MQKSLVNSHDDRQRRVNKTLLSRRDIFSFGDNLLMKKNEAPAESTTDVLSVRLVDRIQYTLGVLANFEIAIWIGHFEKHK